MVTTNFAYNAKRLNPFNFKLNNILKIFLCNFDSTNLKKLWVKPQRVNSRTSHTQEPMLLYSTPTIVRKFCTNGTTRTVINEWLQVSENGTWHTLLYSWPLGCWPQVLVAWAVLVCVPGYYSVQLAAVSALLAAAWAPLAEGVQCDKPKSRKKVIWYPKQNLIKIRVLSIFLTKTF